MSFSVSIIGTGNVATHLANRFSDVGVLVREIAGRNIEHTHYLASQFNAKAITHLPDLDNLSDLYVVCVNDDQIELVAQQLVQITKTLVHTSGATSASVIGLNRENFGVLYPLQTFKKNQTTDWSKIPIFIEASNTFALEFIENIGNLLSPNVYVINSEQRLKLHAAAVVASNFVNYLYITAQDILQEESIPLAVLQPLINEVAQKIEHSNPLESQTGPAIRKDFNVQSQHLSVLSSEQKEIYILLSRLIAQRFK